MKIAMASIDDVRDIGSWSGIPYFSYSSLSEKTDVRALSPLEFKPSLWLQAKTKHYQRGNRGRFFPHYHPHAVRQFGKQVDSVISDADILFSIFPDPVVSSQSEIPWFFFSDATFASLIRTYPGLDQLSETTKRDGHRLWQQSLERAQGACFASEWAAQSAIDDYGADPNKVHVIPMGASVLRDVSQQSLEESLKRRDRTACRLLWMGVDWDRKGGAAAVKVMRKLQEMGIPASLEVVGVDEREIGPQPDGVTCVGFVDKSTPSGSAKWVESFRKAHFFVLPSQAEAFGLVFCEASAFGVPSLAPALGGIPTAVQNGINGYTFDPSGFEDLAATEIHRLWNDSPAYDALCRSSFRRYQDELNWNTFSDRLIALFKRSLEMDYSG